MRDDEELFEKLKKEVILLWLNNKTLSDFVKLPENLIYNKVPSNKIESVKILDDWDADKNKRECIANGEMTCKCENCHTTYEYYPEDPCPVGEEGWCHDCLFGVCDYDE